MALASSPTVCLRQSLTSRIVHFKTILQLLSPALQAFFFSGLYLAVAVFMIRHAVCDWIDFGKGKVTDESKGIA